MLQGALDVLLPMVATVETFPVVFKLLATLRMIIDGQTQAALKVSRIWSLAGTGKCFVISDIMLNHVDLLGITCVITSCRILKQTGKEMDGCQYIYLSVSSLSLSPTPGGWPLLKSLH